MQKPAQLETQQAIQLLAVKFKNCPIKVTMSVLGKKWTVLILRDIALFRINRFNQIRRSIPGLTPRVLVMRLQELEKSGLIKAVTIKEKPRLVEWVLTEKGQDIVPVLMSIIAFGAKWYPEEVFYDNKPRTLSEIYKPGSIHEDR
jgi:DNA-binding HxlR family transcriptional regulator